MKNITFLLAIILLRGVIVNAQNDTLYIMKDNVVINKQSIKDTDVDSIIFNNPQTQADFSNTVAAYWEVTDQPELRKMTDAFRKESVTGLINGQLENVSWLPENGTIDYYVGYINGAGGHIFNDALLINLNPETISRIKFTTPNLAKGSYKVWICMRVLAFLPSNEAISFNVYFNGERTSNIINNRDGYIYAADYSDSKLNLVNQKIYNFDPTAYNPSNSTQSAINEIVESGIAKNWVANAGRYGSQYAGNVIVVESGKQSIELVAISGTNTTLWLDQIHFIPIDEDQNWPRINCVDGTKVYKEDLESGNFWKNISE